MHIRTFNGEANDLDVAITKAEDDAEQLLGRLSQEELIQLTAQTVVEFFNDTLSRFHHIITVVYE